MDVFGYVVMSSTACAVAGEKTAVSYPLGALGLRM